MSVQNIECQIAQAQISRLLDNEPLSQAIMADLEAHVGACPDCQAFIIGQNRSLDTVMGAEYKPAKAKTRKRTEKSKPPAEEDIEATEKERLAFDKLFQPKVPKAAVESKREPSPVTTFWKPLAYSGALAAVLFAMSYLMKNPTALFGERALASAPAQPVAQPTGSPTGTFETRAADTTPPSAAPNFQEDPTLQQEENPKEEELAPSIRNVSETAGIEPIDRAELQPSASVQVGAYVKAPAKPVTAVAPPPAPTKAEAPKPAVTVKTIRRVPTRKAMRTQVRKPRGSVQFYSADGRPL